MACPYCYIKSKTGKLKLSAPAEDGVNRCDCGAWLDCGQYSMTVNGYRGIYDGAIELLGIMAERFKFVLDYYDVDVSEDDLRICFNEHEIIEHLFIPGMGGTSKSNFARAIGVSGDGVEFNLSEPYEEE